ncbi:MAG: glycosyltransferase family 39 protein [Candidatus Omnitrophica bacterium]|nr:glycosyltransferase family 39 protein [Candidatus Omnitrophota bacterium]
MKRYLNFYFVIALLFILCAITSNYIWLNGDNSITGDGSANLLLFSITFLNDFLDIYNENTALITKIIKIKDLFCVPGRYSSIYYPNGLNVITLVSYLLFGKSLFVAKMSLFPYLFILFFFTYKIGKIIYSKTVGFWAIFILFMYPMIFEASRQYQLDIPLSAMVVLTIYFLLKCNYFQNTKYSLFFGFSLGLSMLTKGQAIFFVIGPLIIVVFKTFMLSVTTSRHSSKIKKRYNIIFSFLITIFIASLWWGNQMGSTIALMKEHIENPDLALNFNASFVNKYSLKSISYYLVKMINALGPILYGAGLASILFFIKKKGYKREILLSWIIFPLLVFSFIFMGKRVRHVMPCFPAFALITAWGIDQIRHKRIYYFVVCCLVVLCGMQFYICSYVSSGRIGKRHAILRPMHLLCRCLIDCDYGYETESPTRDNLMIDKVIQIMREHTLPDKRINIGIVDMAEIRPRGWEFLFWLHMKDRNINGIALRKTAPKFFEEFESFEFIIFYIPRKKNSSEEKISIKDIIIQKHWHRLHEMRKSDYLRDSLDKLIKAKEQFELLEVVPVTIKSSDELCEYLIYKRNV